MGDRVFGSCTRYPTLKHYGAAAVGHGAGAACVFLVAALALRAVLVIEQGVLPCEVTIEPRTASTRSAPPGGEFTIRGAYQVVRDGCSATFYPVISWHEPRGAVQHVKPTHTGSFPIQERTEVKHIGRRYTIPLAAVPGTVWMSRVTADWDRWRLPFGLSSVRREYTPVEVLVTPED